VDIGAVEIVACVAGDETTQIVKVFGNYTVDLQALGKWLKERGIKTVAMESTGVYWIPLFEELERQDFECLLISSRSLRRVAGSASCLCTNPQLWIEFVRRRSSIFANPVASGAIAILSNICRKRC
jgi:hypothetical protein